MLSVTPTKQTELDVDRGSGRFPSPDELFGWGFRDGFNGKPQNRDQRLNVDYLRGHIAGYRANPSSAFNLACLSEAPLERGHGDELLNPIDSWVGETRRSAPVKPALTIWRHWDLHRVSSAMKDLREWRRDRAKHGVGTVALALSNGKWLVLVSQDLIEAVLPF